MSYNDRLMGTNEFPVFITRKHWSVVLQKGIKWIVLALITLAIGIAIFIFLPQVQNGQYRDKLPIVAGVVGVLILLDLINLAIDIMRWQNQQYIITNWRVIHTFGILNKTSIDSSLEKVNDVRLDQSWLGRIFNYGNLEIMTGSEVGVNLLNNIASPVAFKKALINAKEKLQEANLKQAPAPIPMMTTTFNGANGAITQPVPALQTSTMQTAVHPPAPADIPGLIDKLKALRDAGALTEQEFQTKKAELLSRM